MAGDPYKIKKNKIPVKQEGVERILALDAATGITGYSIFDNGELINYGTHKEDKELPSEVRINQVKKWLIAMIQESQPDFIGIENIQLQSFGHNNYQVETYRTLANLQGVLLDAIYEAGIKHDLVYSTAWRKYCDVGTGAGRENKKKLAQAQVKVWYK